MKPVLPFPLPKEDQKVMQKFMVKFINGNIFDILWDDFFSYATHFDSKDGMSESLSSGATVTLENGGVALATSNTPTAGDFAILSESRPTDSRFDFTSQSRFRVTTAFTTNSDQEILILAGSNSEHSYGFIVDDGVLSGMAQTAVGSRSKTTILSSIVTGTFYVLDARFFPESGSVEFYLDGVFKSVVTTNLPSSNNTILWTGEIQTDNTTQKAFKMWDIEIMQKRF